MENSEFDTDKVSDSIFDPEISEILAEMETESKHCSILSEKLADFMESSHDYKNVEDNLTKMDSYLN